MITTDRIHNNKILKYIYEAFRVSPGEIKKIIKDFHSEMVKGLSGKKSSLKMLPAYVDRPTGDEKGKFIALDLGGTNLRILELELKGKGRVVVSKERRFILENRYIRGTKDELFDFISDCIKNFIGKQKIGEQEDIKLGFTFSFPIEQTGIASGTLIHWTKDFSATGVEGKDVVRLLNDSLIKKGLNNVKVTALVNDTVGTLVTRSYEDEDCDIGVILGTGTNACYRQRVSGIPRWKGSQTEAQHLIVNIEWGNFNKLRLTPYDMQLDEASDNQKQQILEKMVSGMYLGEIARFIFKDLIRRKMLFEGISSSVLDIIGGLKTEHMSRIEDDRSRNLSDVSDLLKKIGIPESTLKDRILVKKICRAISTRAARISAAALASVIIKIDRDLSRKHTIAIDGTVYEKYPGFAQNIKSTLKEIFGQKAPNIKMAKTLDGSGKGAAIVASVASAIKR